MTEALGPSGGDKVLEIGAGSGYAAAVLSRIAGEVYTVKRIGELAAKASEKLSDLLSLLLPIESLAEFASRLTCCSANTCSPVGGGEREANGKSGRGGEI